MNDELIADLKQFIAGLLAQELSDVRGDIAKFHGDMHAMEQRLTTRIDDLQQSIADALDTSNEATDTQLQNHEKRIKLLEQKVAV